MGQGRVGGQSYPVGKCGWVKGELEVKASLQGSVAGLRESWRSKLSCREVWICQGRIGGERRRRRRRSMHFPVYI